MRVEVVTTLEDAAWDPVVAEVVVTVVVWVGVPADWVTVVVTVVTCSVKLKKPLKSTSDAMAGFHGPSAAHLQNLASTLTNFL